MKLYTWSLTLGLLLVLAGCRPYIYDLPDIPCSIMVRFPPDISMKDTKVEPTDPNFEEVQKVLKQAGLSQGSRNVGFKMINPDLYEFSFSVKNLDEIKGIHDSLLKLQHDKSKPMPITFENVKLNLSYGISAATLKIKILVTYAVEPKSEVWRLNPKEGWKSKVPPNEFILDQSGKRWVCQRQEEIRSGDNAIYIKVIEENRAVIYKELNIFTGKDRVMSKDEGDEIEKKCRIER